MDEGDVIGDRYRLIGPLATGGMGVVWRAVDEQDGRSVAVKRVRTAEWATPRERAEAVERLRREAELAAGLHHENIVEVIGLVDHDEVPWLVMELLTAPTLDRLIRSGGPADPRRVARIGARIAAALAHAHAHGVLHCDVTPSNVFVGEDDHVTLTDFGIARRTDGIMTQGPPTGVRDYLAPEVLMTLPRTAASDVYALGATLYHAVDGAPPQRGSGSKPQLRTVAPARGAGPLGPVLDALLQTTPRRRPTAAEAAALLLAVAEGRSANRSRRWPVVVGTAAAVAALVGATLATDDGGDPQAAGPGLGAAATADPCALIATAPFDVFGATALETDYGNFDRCDVTIRTDGWRARAQVLLDSGGPPPDGAVERRGELTVVRAAPGGDDCRRTVRLPDSTEVTLIGDLESGTGDPALLCRIADVALDGALPVLEAGPVPRRPVPFPSSSLAGVDACALLDPAAVAALPGLGPVTAEPGFARWTCEWDAGESRALVYFDRDQELPSDERPTTIGDRAATEDPNPDGTGCDLTVAHRTYADTNGDDALELVVLDVNGLTATPDPCGALRPLAGALVAALPPV